MTKRFGFTLAEVLITLGIIGVVAAMTIPTLMVNINEKQWSTAATVFEQKLDDALKTMNTQQTLLGHTTTESFVEELSKHYKTNKICSNDKLLDCFSDTVYWGGGDATPEEVDMSIVKTAKHFGQTAWGTNLVGVQFANGVSALIAYNPITSSDDPTVTVCEQDPYSNQISGQKCLAVLYDVSGTKNPNTSGKDLRANGNVKSLGSGCAFTIGNTCYTTTPFIPAPISKAECESIKGDLGINACEWEEDYWAGAVKQCGGVSNLPTLTQLGELASYLYGIENIGPKTDVNRATIDKESALALGFTLDKYNSFLLWANEENSGSTAKYRYFQGTSTWWSDYNRKNTSTNLHAICVSN